MNVVFFLYNMSVNVYRELCFFAYFAVHDMLFLHFFDNIFPYKNKDIRIHSPFPLVFWPKVLYFTTK